jgi:hypothetical protein
MKEAVKALREIEKTHILIGDHAQLTWEAKVAKKALRKINENR